MKSIAIKISAGILFLLFVSQAAAQDQFMDDTQLCVNSVNYSLRYLQVSDAEELHKAVWRIMSDKRLDDAQKLIALTVFHTLQEVSWRMRGMNILKTQDDVNNYIKVVQSKTQEECEFAMNRFRFPDAEMK